MMNLCSGSGRDRHNEICFEGNDCPLCSAQEEINSLAEDLAETQRELDDVRKEKDTL